MEQPTILICYSNPSNTQRLRLDIEHNAIDLVLREKNIPSSYIRRVHATTIVDLMSEIAEGNYHIIQFSGHGTDSGIILESSDRKTSELVDNHAIKQILNITLEPIHAIILTCCYSDSFRDTLAEQVPYLITVDGPAPDVAAITFSKFFFLRYLQTNSIEAAFQFAEILSSRESLNVKINRRGVLSTKGELKIEAVAHSFNKIILDLTAVRDEISNLPISQENFLSAICTTLRAHFSTFAIPMERVAIPFSQFIGIFSWQNQIDPIVCHRIFSVSPDVSEKDFKEVMHIFFLYSRLAAKKYRQQTNIEYAGKQAMLKSTLNDFYKAYEKNLDNNESLRTLAPVPYKVLSAVFNASLSEGDVAWAEEEFPQTILHLETALTALHNFCIQLMDIIAA